MAYTKESSVEKPKARDSVRFGSGASKDSLRNINPNHTGPIFPTVSVDVPNLYAILQDVSEKSRLQLSRALEEKIYDNSNRIE